MRWNLPGTALEVSSEEMLLVEERLRALFLAGGITLSQVSAITGLEAYTVQNWVKRGFLTSPRQKRYSLRQLCRILNINMLKDALAMEQICGLMSYINGHLDDESDDIIDDAELYFMFLQLAIHHRDRQDPVQLDKLLQQSLADYREPYPGAGERIRQVLRIMLTAWAAAQLRQTAEKMVKELNHQ